MVQIQNRSYEPEGKAAEKLALESKPALADVQLPIFAKELPKHPFVKLLLKIKILSFLIVCTIFNF